jgi:lipopolysaccharide biosynthesis glycosyltransferase
MDAAFIGYDPRWSAPFAVLRHELSREVATYGIELAAMYKRGLYTRVTERRGNQLRDVISDAPMSTEFAISRFLTPHLARESGVNGWALFLDCDMLPFASMDELFALADRRYAVMCVKHAFVPAAETKMDGQTQTFYLRKNWSSLVLYNMRHPANNKLTLEMINALPGRDLHAFSWLEDEQIGELPPEWNFIPGHTTLPESTMPAVVHWSEGGPWLEEYAGVPYAAEWNEAHSRWVRGC